MGTSEEAARRNVHEGLKRLRMEYSDDITRTARAALADGRGRRSTGHSRARRAGRRPPACSTSPTRRSTRRSAGCCWPPPATGWCASPTSTSSERGRRCSSELAARVSPRVLAAPRKLDEPRRELDAVLRRRPRRVRAPARLAADARASAAACCEATGADPVRRGLELQARWRRHAGSPRGSRAAGNALGANPLPIVVPCHRVLHSGGGLGGYTGRPGAQAAAARARSGCLTAGRARAG